MDINAIRNSYRRYARNYDLYFGALFQPGRRAVLEQLHCRRGDHVLEVGVGTGLSLPLFPRDIRITGIDLSSHMLERAQARVEQDGLTNVELCEMDAEQMAFEDDSFDKVVAMYVASVVPHPQRLVEEMRRVCKPDGELFIVNHFHSTTPVMAAVEKAVAPLSKLVGFRPDFSLAEFVRQTNLEVLEQRRVNLFGYWTLLRARNNKPAIAPVTARVAGQS